MTNNTAMVQHVEVFCEEWHENNAPGYDVEMIHARDAQWQPVADGLLDMLKTCAKELEQWDVHEQDHLLAQIKETIAKVAK